MPKMRAISSSLELTDHDVACLAIDEREDAVLVGEVADHGIGFEVADSASILCGGGTLRDQPLARETASTVIASVAFTSLLL